MLIKNGKVLLFEENGFVKRDLRVKDGKIQEFGVSLTPTATSASARRAWEPSETTATTTATP